MKAGPDGSHVSFSEEGKTVRFYDANTRDWNELDLATGKVEGIKTLGGRMSGRQPTSSDGKTLLFDGIMGLRCLDLTEIPFKPRELPMPVGQMHEWSFSPDEKFVAVGHGGKSIARSPWLSGWLPSFSSDVLVYDVPWLSIPGLVAEKPPSGTLGAYLEPRSTLTSRTPDGRKVEYVDLRTGRVVRTLSGFDSRVKPARSPDGSLEAFLGGEGLCVKDRKTGQIVLKTKYNLPLSSAIAITPDNQYVYYGSMRAPDLAAPQGKAMPVGKVYKIEIASGKIVGSFAESDGGASGLALSTDGKRMVLIVPGYVRNGRQQASSIEIWDLEQGKRVESFGEPEFWYNAANSLAITSNHIAYIPARDSVERVDLRTCSRLAPIDSIRFSPRMIAISADEKRMLASNTSEMAMIDLETGACLKSWILRKTTLHLMGFDEKDEPFIAMADQAGLYFYPVK